MLQRNTLLNHFVWVSFLKQEFFFIIILSTSVKLVFLNISGSVSDSNKFNKRSCLTFLNIVAKYPSFYLFQTLTILDSYTFSIWSKNFSVCSNNFFKYYIKTIITTFQNNHIPLRNLHHFWLKTITTHYCSIFWDWFKQVFKLFDVIHFVLRICCHIITIDMSGWAVAISSYFIFVWML